jgi:hypothetical protein
MQLLGSSWKLVCTLVRRQRGRLLGGGWTARRGKFQKGHWSSVSNDKPEGRRSKVCLRYARLDLGSRRKKNNLQGTQKTAARKLLSCRRARPKQARLRAGRGSPSSAHFSLHDPQTEPSFVLSPLDPCCSWSSSLSDESSKPDLEKCAHRPRLRPVWIGAMKAALRSAGRQRARTLPRDGKQDGVKAQRQAGFPMPPRSVTR